MDVSAYAPGPLPAARDMVPGRLPPGGAGGGAAAAEQPLGETARDFEAIFLEHLVKEMLPKEGAFFGEKNGAEVFRGLFARELAEQASSRGILGIKQIVESHLARPRAAEDDAANRQPAALESEEHPEDAPPATLRPLTMRGQ
jgi:Rod binding domain-containing protein